MTRNRSKWRPALVALILLGCVAPDLCGQDVLPAVPANRGLIYFLKDTNELVALPFEEGKSSFKSTEPAKETRVGFIEIPGEQATTNLQSSIPRLFLFTSKRPGSHPPFLVSLAGRRGARRVTAVAQKGLAGYAIASEEIIKPNIRVVADLGDQVFMEIRPRISLMPGEYAIIGDDLARIATFRITAK